MAFYQNLKQIIDQKGMTNYKVGEICGIPSQTIDNIIKKKVQKPKEDTLKKLAIGLKVSEYKLLYGTDCFDSENFYGILSDNKITIEDLVRDIGINPLLILRNETLTKKEQTEIAKYLGVTTEELFVPSKLAIHYLKNKSATSYQRPDIKSDLHMDVDMAKLYAGLSDTAKKLFIIWHMTFQ